MGVSESTEYSNRIGVVGGINCAVTIPRKEAFSAAPATAARRPASTDFSYPGAGSLTKPIRVSPALAAAAITCASFS